MQTQGKVSTGLFRMCIPTVGCTVWLLQTSKMILKLRDAHIASLEKKRPDVAEITKDSLIVSGCCVFVTLVMSLSQRSLQDEVVQLRALLDHHPEVMRVAVENGNLKGDTD